MAVAPAMATRVNRNRTPLPLDRCIEARIDLFLSLQTRWPYGRLGVLSQDLVFKPSDSRTTSFLPDDAVTARAFLFIPVAFADRATFPLGFLPDHPVCAGTFFADDLPELR